MVRAIEAAHTARKFGQPEKAPDIRRPSNMFTIIDSNGQLGPVACLQAVRESISRTQEFGLTFTAAKNYIGSNGSMAFYLRRLADAGLIALCGCNSISLVSPPGGSKPMLGTNPFGIAFPASDGNHFIADFATSAIAYGKLMVMKAQGQPIPPGLIIDKSGNPSTDPRDAYEGAILPLADYRGFALGVMAMFLSGSLIGAKDIKSDLYDEDGFFIIAIDPQAAGQGSFAEFVLTRMKQIGDCPPMPGHDDVTLPGERSAGKLAQALAAGTVDVADNTLSELKALA